MDNYGWDIDLSFQERLADALQASRINSERLAYLGGRVTYKRPALTQWRTVTEACAELSVAQSRIRVLCETGRIPGARRKGRPWYIPARLQPDGNYRIEVLPARKGPATTFPTKALLLSPAEPPI